MNIPTLHTDRLVLRPLHPDDADALFSMYSDPETMRFDPELPHPSVGHTRSYIARELNYPGSGFWSIALQGSETPVGMLGFIGGSAIPGIGYMLRRDLWGQGITTEACQAVLAYGFGELGYERVEMWIEPHNLASQRVAGKLGATMRGAIQLKYNYRPDHHPMLVYGVTRSEWRGEKPAEIPVRFIRSQPVLMVRSVTESVDFYRDKLGFTVDFLYRETPEAPPSHAGVARGEWTGSRVVLQLSEAPQGQVIQPGGYVYVFVNTQIDRLFDEYCQKEVPIMSPLANYDWGMREFTIRDLDGHALRFGSSG